MKHREVGMPTPTTHSLFMMPETGFFSSWHSAAYFDVTVLTSQYPLTLVSSAGAQHARGMAWHSYMLGTGYGDTHRG